MDTGILLESGTNELEILEFNIGSNHYGINVAKVKEIMSYQPPTPVPNAHPSIEGIFMPRDTIISIVDLAKSLSIPPSTDPKRDMYIITNFNKLNIGFHVHGVEGIHRLTWEDISKPDETISTAQSSVATGIIKLDGRLIVILDFEKIVTDISPETGLKVTDIEKLGARTRNTSPVLIAEDSPLLSKLIVDSLHKAGYVNVDANSDGLEAWNKISKYKEDGTLKEKVHCIITDIEMPQMDGHRLTKLCKDDPEIHDIPIVIFSSLINDEMRRKGESLGADAQLTKPEIGSLVEVIDKLIL
ncbi:MAG: chemotaxis protein [Lachnospiraceae bacterium]|nr:chemotaxis protein [Lachnospiraceae bacterium]